jgi:hypothetical protein
VSPLKHREDRHQYVINFERLLLQLAFAGSAEIGERLDRICHHGHAERGRIGYVELTSRQRFCPTQSTTVSLPARVNVRVQAM